MKKAGIAAAFLALAATAVTSVYLLQQKQTKTRDLANRLEDVKQAFEERGRLLDGVKENADNAGKQAKTATMDLEKARAELESHQTTKANLDELIAIRNALAKSLEDTQKRLDDSRKTVENSKVGARKEMEDLKQKVEDLKSVGDQLKQANGMIEKLKNDLNTTATELGSQKLLLTDTRAAIKEYGDLNVSPSQVRSLLKENVRLRQTAVQGPSLPLAATRSGAQKTPRSTLKNLPLDLKLPLPAGRLTTPLRTITTP
tara:strand:+ start:288 stop:1061 length:774 start_codon:yes stop_codon:yes gene_type:complete